MSKHGSLLPNSSRIPESLAYLERRRGQRDRSESYFNEAERLDPAQCYATYLAAGSYIILRRFPEALRKLDQVLDITPDDVGYHRWEGGRLPKLRATYRGPSALLAPLHPNADDTQALGNTSLPSDPGAPPCTGHPSAKGNTCQT